MKLKQLQRAQILAYKYVSLSNPLPTALLAAIRNSGCVKKEALDQSAQGQEDRLRRLQTPTVLNAKVNAQLSRSKMGTGQHITFRSQC